jgi:hypothetical protein
MQSAAVLLYASKKVPSTAAQIIGFTTLQGVAAVDSGGCVITVTPTNGNPVACPAIPSALCS